MNINILQKNIGYSFNDISLLKAAMTHSSYVKCENHDAVHNERLEFLGDAILEFCISSMIYSKYPKSSEGEMTRMRALSVCEGALFEASKNLDIGECIIFSNGEIISGGRNKPSVLADALEALIGAIYLDSSIGAAFKFIEDWIPIKSINDEHGANKDYKTQLQEHLQKKGTVRITYRIIGEIGAEHDKTFTSQVCALNECLGEGTGKTKKQSEQNAAKAAIIKLGTI